MEGGFFIAKVEEFALSPIKRKGTSKKLFIYIILIIAVCVGGEFKFYPVAADIRISLGTPVFFFFLLWSNKIRPIEAGALVGLSVVLFRMFLAMILSDQLNWTTSFINHAPVFMYYFVYGICFYLFKTRSFYNRPIIIAFIGMVIENLASIVEIFFRHFFSISWFSPQIFLIIFIISFFRSFFVLSFFNFFLLREASVAEAIQRKRNDEMLIHISNLYVEMVQLQKSMKNAEITTKTCYDLYRYLMKEDNQYAKMALHIAGEIHEIKKDHQRIYSGLAKLKVKEQSTDSMPIKEIIHILKESNHRYAQTLGKSIEISVTIRGDHPNYNCFVVLSLINNLITNSIEAIVDTGIISILVERIGQDVHFQIQDNGPGIASNKQSLVFEPGYTTKYDFTGVASNGIGLSHIKEVIEHLNGKIQLYSNQDERITTFSIILPINTIDEIG